MPYAYCLLPSSTTQRGKSTKNEYSVTLGEGFFTADGMEYFITAKDVNNVESRSPADIGFYSIIAHTSTLVSEETVHGGSAQNAYRMISVPLNPVQGTIEEQLDGRIPDGDIGPDWRLFRFSPGGTTPKEYPGIEGFSPGKAFWLITVNDFRLKAPEGTTVTTSEPFTLSLAPGWNDIANPWIFDISWDDKENPSKGNLDVLYTYEGEWSSPLEPPLILKPWKGYAVNNLENRTVIIRLQPTAQKIEKPAVRNDAELWKLTIKASSGKAKDTANHLGVRNDAEPQWDRYDHVEPPPVGEYVSVSFPHHDWIQYPYEYTVDFRPPEQTISWDFTVKTNITDETVNIELAGMENLPDELNVKIIDSDSGLPVYMENDSFAFVSESGLTKRNFRLVASNTPEPEPEQNAPEPKWFVTAKSYPNPFNPQTTLHYELSMPGNVKIVIFNSLGQKVCVYDMGYLNGGVHELVFDARGLTSGLYIYHIDTGYSMATGKMLYMK